LKRSDVQGFFEAEQPLVRRGEKALMVALLDMSQDIGAPTVDAEALRLEMSRRSGVEMSQAAFRKQISRINASLAEASAPFTLATRGGQLLTAPTEAWNRVTQMDSVQRALVSHSGEKMRGDLDSFVPPRAVPDRLLVMWSYAWLAPDQQKLQIEIFDALKRKLAHPAPKWAHLPRVELWRDEERMGPGDQPTAGADEACVNAFLALIVFSDRYPTRPACLREADHFLDPEGNAKADKRHIVLRFNCAVDEIHPRFTRRLVYPGGDSPHLLDQWAKGDAADRHRLIADLAEAVLKQAEQWCGQPGGLPPAGGPGGAPSRGKDRVERFMAEQAQRMRHDDVHSTPPLARPGADGYAAANGPDDGGVDIVERLIDWASSKDPLRPRVTALLGDFGMGKTVTCQLVCRRMLERVGSGEQNLPTPVYFDLRDIPKPDRTEEITLEKLFDDLLRRTGETAPTAREVIEFIRSRRALVIFDGLDEVTNKYSVDVARVIYRQLISIVPAAVWSSDARLRRDRLMGNGTSPAAQTGPSILLSCRSQYFADFAAERGFLSDSDRSGLKVHEDIAVYTMLPFTADQIRDYVARNLPEEDRERALNLIESTYDLGELARRPILLRYIGELVHRLEAEKLAGRTINLSRLYRILVRQAFERDAGKHVIPIPDKERLLENLAFYLHRRRREDISSDRLVDWLDGEIGRDFPKLAGALQGEDGLKLSEVFVQDLRNATLLSRPGDTGFRFGHTSLREFFLAEGLYRAVLDGTADEKWATGVPSPETIDFLLQRHAVEDVPERHAFESGFARLLGSELPLKVRWLAFSVWRRSFESGRPLPRADYLDCSDFQLDNEELRGRPDRPLPLERSRWHGARLRQSVFEDADLTGADFERTDATGAWFSRCSLAGSRFRVAALDGSLWDSCALDEDAFQDASLELAEAHNSTLGGKPWRPQRNPSIDAHHWEILTRYPGLPRAIGAGEIDGTPVLALAGGRGIQIMDSRTGVEMRRLTGASGPIGSLACAKLRDSTVIAGGSPSGKIFIWDAKSGRLQLTIDHGENLASVSLSTIKGDFVLIAAGENKITIFNAVNGNKIRSWKVPSLFTLKFDVLAVDEKIFLATADYHKMSVWELASAKLVYEFEKSDWINAICFTIFANQPALAVATEAGSIHFFEFQSGKERGSVEHGAAVTSLVAAEGPDGPRLASAGRDGTVKLWSPDRGVELRSFEGSEMGAAAIAFQTIDGRQALIANGGKGFVRLWDACSGDFIYDIGKRGPAPHGVITFMLDGRMVVASGGHLIEVRDLRTRKLIHRFPSRGSWASVYGFANVDGVPALLAGGDANVLRLWDISAGRLMRSFEAPHDQYVYGASLTQADGEPLVAATTGRGQIMRWRASTGEALPPIAAQGAAYTIASGSVGGAPVLFATSIQGLHAWNAETGEPLPAIKRPATLFEPMVQVSVEGRPLLAIGDSDGTIRLLDIRTGATETNLTGHEASVSSLSTASVAGRSILASSAVDGTIRVWSCDDGACLGVIRRPGSYLPTTAMAEVDGSIAVAWTEAELIGAATLGGDATLIIPGSSAMVNVRWEEDGGQTLVSAAAGSWKHFYATYQSEAGNLLTSVHEMPRADDHGESSPPVA
jgi:WD40 repeat protein